MGLFDGYDYGPQGYSDGGNLIGRLLSQLQTQGQYQPGAGFGASPMDASAAMPAQQQNAPIAVGDYQMPRVGSGFPQGNPNYPYSTPQEGVSRPPAQAMAQMQPQAGPQAPPLPSILQPSGGNGVGDRLSAGLNSFAGNLHSGVIGSILSGVNGLVTGQRNDPRGQQQEMLRSQYQSLIPILGEAKARLAVLNPEIGKAMVAQALSGKQYAFTTSPDGTVIRTDAHAGTAEPVYQGGLKPTFGVVGESDGTKTYGWTDPSKRTVTPYQAPGGGKDDKGVMGPDGKLIPYPEGVDRKTFRNEISKINADAAGGKKTEVQAKSEKFGNQMELAEKNIKGLEGEYTSTLGAGGFFRGTEYVPGGNALQSSSYQKFRQARDSYLTALLRDESGAAIGSQEFNRREKELFPQPGDSESVIKQKRELRTVAIEGMKKAAGPGYKSPDFAGEDAAKADIDALLKRYGGK